MGIGPSSKETTMHHFRDPLIQVVSEDKDIDLLGIIVEGTPERNNDKLFVAERSAALAEAMRVDGVIVSIDSWGNSHIDFASAIEAVGKRGIPVVGMSFVGNQADFVIRNKYMDTIIDFNKNAIGVETEVVGENNIVELDAVKALAILKTKMRKKNTLKEVEDKETILRKLVIKYFHIDQVLYGEKTIIEDRKLYIKRSIGEIINKEQVIENVKINIINPNNHDMFINSILDFSPIATKISGKAGEGVSHVLKGAVVMLTAVEKKGFQPCNIGSSEGVLKEQVKLGRRGTPDENDIIINIDVTLQEGAGRTREGIMASHRVCDKIVQEIRDYLKSNSNIFVDEKQECFDKVRVGKKKVVIIKQVSGLGCMYDTGIFPYEPCGFLGCTSVMDFKNIPIVLSPNEYRDGVIRSMS